MSESITSTVLQYGVLGVCVVVFAWVIAKLWHEFRTEQRAFQEKLEACHKARLEDAERNASELREVVEKCTAALVDTTASLEELSKMLEQMRSELMKSRRGVS